MDLSPCILPLQRSQRRIRSQREHSRQENTHITTISAKLPRNGPNVPCLAHARNAASKIPHQQGHHGCRAPRQFAWLVPRAEIVTLEPSEPFVFDEEDEREAHGPVAEQADKVADDCGEVVFACYG